MKSSLAAGFTARAFFLRMQTESGMLMPLLIGKRRFPKHIQPVVREKRSNPSILP